MRIPFKVVQIEFIMAIKLSDPITYAVDIDLLNADPSWAVAAFPIFKKGIATLVYNVLQKHLPLS